MKNFLKKSLSILIGIVLILGVMPINTLAYGLLGCKITSPITFVPHNSFGSTSISHMNNALYTWNAAAGTNIMYRDANKTHSSTAFPTDDAVSRIYKVNAGPDYVGATSLYPKPSFVNKDTYGADINLNPYYSFANSAQPDCYDVWSVFLHESGHAAGLKDLYDMSSKSAVMFGVMSENLTKRALTFDDDAGIRHIYR